jgi:hypothetical protein
MTFSRIPLQSFPFADIIGREKGKPDMRGMARNTFPYFYYNKKKKIVNDYFIF